MPQSSVEGVGEGYCHYPFLGPQSSLDIGLIRCQGLMDTDHRPVS